MTNQEAINYLLDPLSLPHDMDIMDKLNWHEDAVNMAIEALKAQELKNVPDTNVGSMISRQAAIDALHMHLMYRMGTDSNKKRLDDWINGVPSAQPEIIRCKDCKFGEQDEVGRWFCRSLGCQIGNEDGSGFCADAERRTNNANIDT